MYYKRILVLFASLVLVGCLSSPQVQGAASDYYGDNTGVGHAYQLNLRDTDRSTWLKITAGSDLSAERTLTLTTGDASRTITFSGNPTLADWFDQSVKTTASPTFAGLTVNAFAITVSGAPTLNDWFDQSVKQAASPTFAGLTVNAHAFTVSGAPTLNDWFDQSVKQAATPTFGGVTVTKATGNVSTIISGTGTSQYAYIDVIGRTAGPADVQGRIISDTGGAVYIGAYTNHPLGFLMNNIEHARIHTDGKFYIYGPDTATGGELRLHEGTANGTNYVGLKAPDSLSSNFNYTFPSSIPAGGGYFRTDDTGLVTWEAGTAGTTTVTYQVAAAVDDTLADVTNTTLYPANNTGFTGKSGGNVVYSQSFRFTSVTIPQGAIILSAYLKITSDTSYAGTAALTKISAEDSDDAVAPTDYAEFAALSLTTAQIDWDVTAAWTADIEYSSPNIASVVQEVIDRALWVPGNAMQILWKDDSSTTSNTKGGYHYDSSTTKCAQLTITYQVSGTHSLLSATHTDTTTASVQRGDLITGQGASPTWTRLGKGTAGQVLKSDGTDLAWGSLPYTQVDCTAVSGADDELIQAAIDALPTDGGIVHVTGTCSVNATITLGDGGGVGAGTRHGIWLRGSGTGESNFYTGSYNGATIFQWAGAQNGTVIKVNGSAQGCKISDLTIDGGAVSGITGATNLIEANYAFELQVDNVLGYRWQGGYAIKIHTTGGWGPGVMNQTWNHVRLTDPYSTSAYALDIAPAGSGNVNEVTFTSCFFEVSNAATAIGIRLGYADHITFNRVLLGRDGGETALYGIQVEPIADHTEYPQNIVFNGSPIIGGVHYVSTNAWTGEASAPSLIFYPYYTADSQVLPPLDANGSTTLPLKMVGGRSDKNIELAFLHTQEQTVAAASAITISRPNVYLTNASGTTTVSTIALNSAITPGSQSGYEILLFPSISAGSIVLAHGCAGSNQICTTTGSNYTMSNLVPVKLYRSASSNYWHIIGP